MLALPCLQLSVYGAACNSLLAIFCWLIIIKVFVLSIVLSLCSPVII